MVGGGGSGGESDGGGATWGVDDRWGMGCKEEDQWLGRRRRKQADSAAVAMAVAPDVDAVDNFDGVA